ncbi:hypothetical protein B0H13DRAFT_2075750 [Mycena leptocephala]|nr:hypothetical protein B0H13DRAFT_2075750 [Mycena leptocephala]
MSNRLPRELLDIIVSELRTDIPNLRACALSFRAMVLSAQTQIFYKVILHQPAASSGIKRSHFQKLSRVLESSPHIAPLIKDLQIVDDGPHPVLSEWRTLSGMLPLFVLKRISIRCTKAPLDWDRIHREFKASLQGVFASPRLEDIQLQGVLISAPQECALFHIFMNAHADLQHLSFSYKHRKSDESSLLIPPVWAPKLRSLVIDTSHVKGLLRGLCSPAMDYSRLRTLELLFAIKDRNVLEHLKIGYPGSNGNTDAGLNGLRFLPNLRTIHFHRLDRPHELVKCLRYCAANASLEKIVLGVFLHKAVYFPKSDWMALATASKDLNKTVQVFLGEFGPKDLWPQWLESNFFRCLEAAGEALAIPSSGLTIERSTSLNYVPLAEINDG